MHVHILGICGTFMGGIAALARESGHRVTGSDRNVYPPMSTQLAALGIGVTEGWDPAQLEPRPDVVVVGNVLSRGNPAIEALLDRGLPYTSGPAWLATHVLAERHVLAVAGTHGKTTTSGMLAWMLECAGLAPGFLIGGVAGNFSAYYIGLAMVLLMSLGFLISNLGLDHQMLAPAVFAFGLVAFGFLGMGPVTIAVDSYGPVTDNAQSVYELSLIEQVPSIKQELKKDYNIDVNFERAKEMLEANDGAGNTFKATAKPVLIGTAVVGATTMIFSIIMALTKGLTENVNNLSLLHAPFVLGLVTGGAMIYWFTGASTQAVTTGAYRAVEFIKANIKLDGAAAASIADSKKVVEICTKYAQKGMLNIFIAVFFATLAFAFVEPFFFIGYLFSIAIFGLYQAIFMANAGGAWDNAKKIVEVEMKQKGTPLHDATVIGDTVGDPFKDTSSVALNPVIKFTTLFGLLAVELAVQLTASQGSGLTHVLAAAFFVVSFVFVYRSFYGMRIREGAAH